MPDIPPIRRVPTADDLTSLAKALSAQGVDYVVIGGAAMALHGYPRMTKDIDLFLPVDPENNRRLIEALKSVPNSEGALSALRPQFMDQGYSTSFEGDIAIDLLYVAASKAFDDLRDHIKRVEFNGVPISTLDVDGMLISKRTTREEDIPDRRKLERLRNALFEQERQRRLAELPSLMTNESAAVRLFGELAAKAMIASAGGGAVAWQEVESKAIAIGLGDRGLQKQEVADALCNHSPGAVMPGRQAAIRKEVLAASEVARGSARSDLPRG